MICLRGAVFYVAILAFHKVDAFSLRDTRKVSTRHDVAFGSRQSVFLFLSKSEKKKSISGKTFSDQQFPTKLAEDRVHWTTAWLLKMTQRLTQRLVHVFDRCREGSIPSQPQAQISSTASAPMTRLKQHCRFSWRRQVLEIGRKFSRVVAFFVLGRFSRFLASKAMVPANFRTSSKHRFRKRLSVFFLGGIMTLVLAGFLFFAPTAVRLDASHSRNVVPPPTISHIYNREHYRNSPKCGLTRNSAVEGTLSSPVHFCFDDSPEQTVVELNRTKDEIQQEKIRITQEKFAGHFILDGVDYIHVINL